MPKPTWLVASSMEYGDPQCRWHRIERLVETTHTASGMMRCILPHRHDWGPIPTPHVAPYESWEV